MRSFGTVWTDWLIRNRKLRHFTSSERIHAIVNHVRPDASILRRAAHRRPRILHKVSRKIHSRRQGASKPRISFATT
jgi:hypothetical protein